jgi:hypothetical protein
LIGSCCEYQRTIDYDTVKVGYLGMMGIWIYPLEIQDIKHSDFVVYPTIGNGMFQVSFKGSRVQSEFELSVYSMKGIKILAREFAAGSGNSVDLRSFPNGEYILVLTEKKQIISSARLVKIE